MTNLCGLTATRLIGLRIRPARLDRQPIAGGEIPSTHSQGQGKGQGQATTAGPGSRTGTPISPAEPTEAEAGRPSGHSASQLQQYINASINLLLWMRQAHGSDQALGGLARAMRGIKPSINVLALLPWQHLLRSWTNVHEQQDAAEFVTYLFGHSTPEAYHGRWESRMLVEDPDDSTDTMAIHESGLTSIPLVLEIAGPSLQHSIYAWHTQARVHALCSPPPPLLLLQLKRFPVPSCLQQSKIGHMLWRRLGKSSGCTVFTTMSTPQLSCSSIVWLEQSFMLARSSRLATIKQL